MSEVLQQAGDADEARAVLRQMVERDAQRRQDPWWHYLVEPPGIADERLAVLRRQVRE